MGETLMDPPLVEAVCELRLADDSPWDEGVPDRLAAALPQFPRHVTPAQEGAIVRQLEAPDASAIVQVGPRVLVVNHLRPYDRWARFREHIEAALKAFQQANPGARPREVVLSATNLFQHVDGRLDLGEILRRAPALHDRLAGGKQLGFTVRQDFALEDPDGVLICQTGIGVVDGIGEGLLLRLEFVSGPWSAWDALLPLLDQAHDRIHQAFVEVLTPAEYARRKAGR